MAIKDYLYANLMALFVSAGLIVFSLRYVVGETESKFLAIQGFEFFENRTKLSSYLTVIVVGLLFVTLPQRPKRQKLAPGIPIVGGSDIQHVKQNRKRFIHDGKSMLAEGYRKTKGGFFYVPSNCGERLMLPVKYLEDLKTAPIDQVDFVATFIEYLIFGEKDVRGLKDFQSADVMPAVQREIRNAFDAAFPPCEDWTEINVVERITKVVARVSSCMFGGIELSENEKWVEASIAFAIDGFHGAQKIKRYPHVLRPIAKYFISEIRSIAGHYAEAEKAAIPILEARQKAGEKALDLLYWMSDQAKGSERNMKFIASILLKVSFAAIHTSAAAPSQLIYDLCAMPEYVEPLRKEVESVLDPDGNIDKKSFGQLVKLDSIMKESQRFNPLLLITFERVVHTPYRLSDGFVIPAHTHIGVPTSSLLMDPDLYPDPTRYDGFRFAKIRTHEPNADASARAQYAASNPSSMSFGFGRHSCPGRFFAANEIKAIMGYLLLNFDMKFPEGKEKRPESLLFETQFLPNPTATVMFKRRKQA
ncbi:hypothetical protein OEA41_000094 [Lepraria neglecta]|uniref:Cytochrome P450 n=1 Tax=Lepraria neglecta TaxID=209136 RepID=A0AAD9ZI14_9LECA|nr:hypothetical protein OEA41_000094 [Lepraria neglecta]